MLAGREGQPRSGKSYETVKVDLLEALRRKRRVFARINGLSIPAIAEYLKVDADEVSSLLTIMTDADVRAWLVCTNADDGAAVFPHLPIGALIIVDECHEFWPVGRAELPPDVVNFFAKHGHWTLDVLLLTQDFKEVHRSVIRRLQKKNYYTKLDALGADQSYSVRFYSAPTAGKFELMGSEKRKYDPEIYPLYHGITPDADANPVYDVGTTTLWRTMRKPAIAMAVALVIGIFAIGRFFFAPSSTVEDSEPAKTPIATAPEPYVVDPFAPKNAVPATVQTGTPSAAPVPPPPPPPPEKKLPAPIRYLVDFPSEIRPRYLGRINDKHFVEWRDDSGSQVIERLDSVQLSAMGWDIKVEPYGLIATYDDEAIIFTPWPVEPRFQQSERLTGDIANSPPLVTFPDAAASITGATPATASGGLPYGSMAQYGDHGVAPKGTNSIGN